MELNCPSLAEAVAHLLRKPDMQGHVWLRLSDMLDSANDDPIETRPRNLALREIYLARGLYISGDFEGLGREILNRYAYDLRGHFARHAQALLDGSFLKGPQESWA